MTSFKGMELFLHSFLFKTVGTKSMTQFDFFLDTVCINPDILILFLVSFQNVIILKDAQNPVLLKGTAEVTYFT